MVASLTGGPAYLVRLADFDDAAGIGNVHVVGWRAAYGLRACHYRWSASRPCV